MEFIKSKWNLVKKWKTIIWIFVVFSLLIFIFIYNHGVHVVIMHVFSKFFKFNRITSDGVMGLLGSLIGVFTAYWISYHFDKKQSIRNYHSNISIPLIEKQNNDIKNIKGNIFSIVNSKFVCGKFDNYLNIDFKLQKFKMDLMRDVVKIFKFNKNDIKKSRIDQKIKKLFFDCENYSKIEAYISIHSECDKKEVTYTHKDADNKLIEIETTISEILSLLNEKMIDYLKE